MRRNVLQGNEQPRGKDLHKVRLQVQRQEEVTLPFFSFYFCFSTVNSIEFAVRTKSVRRLCPSFSAHFLPPDSPLSCSECKLAHQKAEHVVHPEEDGKRDDGHPGKVGQSLALLALGYHARGKGGEEDREGYRSHRVPEEKLGGNDLAPAAALPCWRRTGRPSVVPALRQEEKEEGAVFFFFSILYYPVFLILFFLQRLSWHFFSFSQFFRKKAALQSARPEKEKPQSRHSAINAPAQRSCWMWK